MEKDVSVIGRGDFAGSRMPADPGRKAEAALGFRWIHYKAIGQLTGALDYVLIVTASVAAGAGYHYILLRANIPDLSPYVGAGNIVAALFVLGVASRGNYKPSKIASARVQLKALVLFWPLALSSLALFLFLLKTGQFFSRGSVVIFGILGFFILLVSRFWISSVLKAALARGAIAGDRAITIADPEAVLGLSQTKILQKSGAREIKRLLLPSLTSSNYSEGLRLIDQAVQFAKSNSIDCVLLALRWSDEYRRNLICERLQVLPVSVRLLPDQNIESIFSRTDRLGSEFAIEIQRAPLSGAELAVKRTLDVVLAGGLLVVLLPFLLLVGLLIKLESPGPVIFRQRRQGFNGRQFTIFKFRSMKVLEDGRVIHQACQNDTRVTRIGRFLRATSIDELPQLINVLRGQMSLVGPRPHALAHDDDYSMRIANYAYRQHVKPGVTGWAQVNGFRGETITLALMEQRVAHDLWYVKNWSFWLDLRIVTRTVFEVLRGRNAY